MRTFGSNVPEVRRDGSSGRATSEILIALLRASLGTGALPDAPRLAECNWARFTLLARHHGLVPILYRSLRERAASVPAEWLRRFKAQYVATAFHNQLAQTCVDEVGTAFDTERISVIVMKGAALQRTLYDDPGLRVLGDVDLLVEDRDVERAGAQLQRMGLKLIASAHADERGPLCHIHLVYCRPQPRSIPVELHWRLFEPYQPYVFDLDVVRAQARQLSGMPPNVLVMAPEHELAHLCVHLDRHAVTFRSLVNRNDWFELLLLPQGLGRLLWLYDIALYLQRRSALIDWGSFVDTACRWAIDGRVYATLELSRRALGVGPPPEVLQALHRGQPRFVERIAHRALLAAHRANEMQGNGSTRAPRPHSLARWSGHVLRFAHTWISVFPPSAYLRARYGTPGAPLWLRGRHLREVLPGLWAETRDRLRSAVR
ncbi:MAG TPA: nucleotidyltransferase family protein [Candidatus Acidoferrales bacterium]|nr:nucleotidyltransferase family protein [Candidatus Acidoferrales bacterium]